MSAQTLFTVLGNIITCHNHHQNYTAMKITIVHNNHKKQLLVSTKTTERFKDGMKYLVKKRQNEALMRLW